MHTYDICPTIKHNEHRSVDVTITNLEQIWAHVFSYAWRRGKPCNKNANHYFKNWDFLHTSCIPPTLNHCPEINNNNHNNNHFKDLIKYIWCSGRFVSKRNRKTLKNKHKDHNRIWKLGNNSEKIYWTSL